MCRPSVVAFSPTAICCSARNGRLSRTSRCCPKPPISSARWRARFSSARASSSTSWGSPPGSTCCWRWKTPKPSWSTTARRRSSIPMTTAFPMSRGALSPKPASGNSRWPALSANCAPTAPASTVQRSAGASARPDACGSARGTICASWRPMATASGATLASALHRTQSLHQLRVPSSKPSATLPALQRLGSAGRRRCAQPSRAATNRPISATAWFRR